MVVVFLYVVIHIIQNLCVVVWMGETYILKVQILRDMSLSQYIGAGTLWIVFITHASVMNVRSGLVYEQVIMKVQSYAAKYNICEV